MKLRDLFWFATGATISYQLVKNREPLKNEFNETKQLTDGIQSNLTKIKKNIEIIQEQRVLLNQLLEDFSYKARVFSQQANASVEQIQTIWSEKSNDHE